MNLKEELIQLDHAKPVTHAHIHPILHPRLGVEVDGRSCVCYLRFRRRVRIDHLELPLGDGVVVRSRDGQLHDPAFLWINGVACAFGVLEKPVAKRALTRLEALRKKMGLIDAPLGLPSNLLPIPEVDQPKPVTEGAAAARLEIFCNGLIWPGSMEYYIRALATHGLKANARKLARDMEEGFLADALSPGYAEGAEFFSWEGLACGYEGTFGPNFGVLYALAIERGLFDPPDPEWWPADEM